MRKIRYPILCIFTVIVMLLLGSVDDEALASVSWNDDIYFQQTYGGTCTLASAAMMIRARMVLGKNDNWPLVNDYEGGSLVECAWVEDAPNPDDTGLKHQFTYNLPNNSGWVTVNSASTSGTNLADVKSMLDDCPEGFVLYCYDFINPYTGKAAKHAVFITDYEGDTIYCADPSTEFREHKRIPLNQSSFATVANLTTQQAILNKARCVWWITDYNIVPSSDQPTPTPPPTGSEMETGYDQTLPNGNYIITSAVGPTYFMDIEGVALPAAAGANVQLYGELGDDLSSADTWTMAYSNGFYSIKQNGTNMSLEIEGSSLYSGASAKVNTSTGNINQQWAISEDVNATESQKKGYRIQARQSSFALDLSDGSVTSTTNIIQNTVNGANTESWLFIPYHPSQPIDEGRYIIAYKTDTSYELNTSAEPSTIPNGTNVQLWSNESGKRNNSFELIKLANGYYKVKHVASGKCLDVNGASPNYKTPVMFHEDNGSTAQQWAIISNGNGYSLISKCNGYALDLADGITGNGKNMEVYPVRGNENQRWTFIKAEYSIHYDANGGTGAPADQSKYYMQDLTLSADQPTRDGYEFIGWGIFEGNDAPSFQPGDVFDWDQDQTFYAVWRKAKPGLQVKYIVDGQRRDTLEGIGSYGVLVTGENTTYVDLDSWSGEFNCELPTGCDYEIYNINTVLPYRYQGATGNLIGQTTDKLQTIVLSFRTVYVPDEDWTEMDQLPDNLDTDITEMQFKLRYTCTGRTSPGEEWELESTGETLYENDGDPERSDYSKPTSDTYVLVGHYYFHWCGDPNDPIHVSDHEQPGLLTRYHFLSEEEASKYMYVCETGYDNDRPYFVFKWNADNPKWPNGVVYCDTNGSRYYYQGFIYQKRKPYQINTYVRTSDWTDEIDQEATSVTYRLRMKRDCTLTFNPNGGIYEVETLTGFKGQRFDLPTSVPYRMGYAFKYWSLTESGLGEGWSPGGYIIPDDDITLIAQWRKLDTFLLPEDLMEVEEESFASTKAEFIRIPENCRSIGDYAFRNCIGLKQIWIPENCTVGLDAFDGCENVLVFGVSGSPADDYCETHTNCTFVQE